MFSEKFQKRILVISIILCIFGVLTTDFDDDPIPGVPTVETEDAATYSSEEGEHASGHSPDFFSSGHSFQSAFPEEKLNRRLPNHLGIHSLLRERDSARSEQMKQAEEIRKKFDKEFRELERRALATLSEGSVGKTTQSPSVSQDNPDVEVKEPTEPTVQKEDDNN
ncbi:MAG: hypothetical protein IKW85_10615 [Muribaculaceae bacterium]|nr:hypothetical protein [Muribaculaceae bacterium]